MIRSLADVRRLAAGPAAKVAVAAAQGTSTLRAILEAASGGWVKPILFGDRTTIEARLRELGVGSDSIRVEHLPDPIAAARAAVGAVRAGEADVLLKGSVATPDLMREVLDRNRGLRAGSLLSDVFFFDYAAGTPPRIVGITDGGVTPAPDLEAKTAIARNAVRAFRRLGIDTPRVAFLSATEKPSPTFPASLEAAAIAELAQTGVLGPCIADGPLALDLALSPAAGPSKGVESPVGGRADILVFPDLESANITAKAVQYTVPIEPGHVIVGGTAPILIPSRSETTEARLNSLALGVLMARTWNG